VWVAGRTKGEGSNLPDPLPAVWPTLLACAGQTRVQPGGGMSGAGQALYMEHGQQTKERRLQTLPGLPSLNQGCARPHLSSAFFGSIQQRMCGVQLLLVSSPAGSGARQPWVWHLVSCFSRPMPPCNLGSVDVPEGPSQHPPVQGPGGLLPTYLLGAAASSRQVGGRVSA
jgi:hypothetical protein